MTLKDYINKELLTAEEEKQLINELYTTSFSYDEYPVGRLPLKIREIIENQGKKDGNIAYNLYFNWSHFEGYYDETDLETDESLYWGNDWKIHANYWFMKSLELYGSDIAFEIDDYLFKEKNGEIFLRYQLFDKFSPIIGKAESECFNTWGCRFALGLNGYDRNYSYARQFFESSKEDEAKISLYYIYSNGIEVKKDLEKANSFIKNLPANTPLYAFKSNISEGIKIERIEEDNEQEQPKKEKKQRKPRKKNKVKSFFKKILSLFK